jgi:hypothetical protein
MVEKWLNPYTAIFFPPPPPYKPAEKKCPDIPCLDSYELPPRPDFWKIFPSHPLPSHPSSVLNIQRLASIIKTHRNDLSLDQRMRSERVLSDLKEGGAVPFSVHLPAARISNTPSVTEHGEEFTDTLAWWIRKKYVAGPFAAPPLPSFRTNSMMAVEQRNKIRIIMNLSAPKGDSYNDAIHEIALQKVTMSSARLFGYSVVECGRGAKMSKFDMVDAYKTVPAHSNDLRLQGFTWLGRYFIELKKVFGSKEAVSAFDRLNNTLVTLATCQSRIQPHLIHRTLDDVPLVTPAHSSKGTEFAEAYQKICKEIGAELAPMCPKLEKAFKNSTKGTVLGIQFNTMSLTWNISREKKLRILEKIKSPLLGRPINLLELQRLIGTLNDVGQMCPFLRGFRQPLHLLLTAFQDREDISLPIPPEVQADLRIWAAALDAAEKSLPIPRRPTAHLPSAVCFASDASGAQFAKCAGKFITLPYEGDRRAVSINTIEDDDIWFFASVTFPTEFLLKHRDSLDRAYGCKSSTLEAIGLILPFLCCPHLLIGREVTLLTDNEALVYGWEKRRVPHDTSASIFIRTLHLLSAFLGSSVEVRHLPRMSSPSAELSDALTRSTTTKPVHLRAIKDAPTSTIPAPLLNWLRDPKEDWQLPLELLKNVQKCF